MMIYFPGHRTCDFSSQARSQAWWFMPWITLEKQRQRSKISEFKTVLVYRASSGTFRSTQGEEAEEERERKETDRQTERQMDRQMKGRGRGRGRCVKIILSQPGHLIPLDLYLESILSDFTRRWQLDLPVRFPPVRFQRLLWIDATHSICMILQSQANYYISSRLRMECLCVGCLLCFWHWIARSILHIWQLVAERPSITSGSSKIYKKKKFFSKKKKVLCLLCTETSFIFLPRWTS